MICTYLNILYMFVIYCCILLCNLSEEIPSIISLISEEDLIQWYDPIQLCMMNTTIDQLINPYGNTSYWTFLQYCESITNLSTNHIYKDGFYTLPSSAFSRKNRDGCCTSDVKLKDRGYNWIYSESANQIGNNTICLDILYSLGYQNKSLMFIGDSMNNQVFTAFLEECKREERNTHQYGQWLDDCKYEFDLYSNPEQYSIPNKLLRYIHNVVKYSFIHFNNRYHIYIYAIDMWYGKHIVSDENLLMELVIPKISSYHHDGLVILGNIGHHLDAERKLFYNHDERYMINTISDYLYWLNDLKYQNQKNIIIFRETTPSHFDSPLQDGSYEVFKEVGNDRDYNYMTMNTWDNTLYHCHSINTSNPFIQTYENKVVELILSYWNQMNEVFSLLKTRRQLSQRRYHSNHHEIFSLNNSIHILSVFKYLAPFYRLKYGYCGYYERMDVLDCVHFCGWSPPMWIPIWIELLHLIQSSNTIIDTKTSVIKDTLEYFNKYDISEVYVVIIPVEFDTEKEVVNEEEKEVECSYYLLYRGSKRQALNIESIEFEIGHNILASNILRITKDKQLLIDNVIQSFNVSLIIELVNHLPLNLPIENRIIIQEKSCLKLKDKNEYFYFINNSRHVIPNWDTFCALGLRRDQVIQISFSTLSNIPQGEPMEPLDWPVVC